MKKPSNKIIKEALFKTNGILVNTAEEIGCSRQALNLWIQASEELKEAHKEAKEHMLDKVEHQLMKNILDGKETSIIWYLKCQGRERGWKQPELGEGNIVGTFNQLNIVVQSDSSKQIVEDIVKKLSDGN